MTVVIKTELEERKQEIFSLIQHIYFLEKSWWNLFALKKKRKSLKKSYFTHIYKDESGSKICETYSTQNISFSADLSAGLKSNVAIMLYGIVEYTITNILDIIFCELSKHEFDKIKEDIKAIIGRNFQKYKSSISKDTALIGFINELLSYTNLKCDINKIANIYKNSEHLSGNVRQEEIDWLFLKYGVPRPTMTGKISHRYVDELLGKRNRISHWEIPFKKAYQTTTIETLEQQVTCTISFLESLLWKVDEYINHRMFLIPTT